MKLIGSKVAIRSIEKKDLHTAIRWWNDSETMYLADDNPHPHKTLEELEEEFAKEKSEWSEYMERFVIETIDSHLIGDVLFYNYRRDTNNVFFGIFIGEKPYLGKGYGADAIKLSLEYLFEYRRVHKVELTVSDFNTRAIKVFEKSGFRRDGVLRDNAVVEGKYVDHILMSILDTEYFKLHDNPLWPNKVNTGLARAQAGERYRSLSKMDQDHLVDNIVESLSHAEKPIQKRMVENLIQADPELGKRVTKSLKF